MSSSREAVDLVAVERWIARFLTTMGGDSADPDRDLFADGGLDSLAVVNLIVGLEATFKIRLTEDDLQDPRFATVRGIAHIVSEAARRAE